jgi:hypothetical protein
MDIRIPEVMKFFDAKELDKIIWNYKIYLAQ